MTATYIHSRTYFGDIKFHRNPTDSFGEGKFPKNEHKWASQLTCKNIS